MSLDYEYALTLSDDPEYVEVMRAAYALAKLYPDEHTRATDPTFHLRRAILMARFSKSKVACSTI